MPHAPEWPEQRSTVVTLVPGMSFGLLSDVLDAKMTGHLIRHAAERRLEIGLEQSVPVAGDEVLERIEHGLAHRLHVGIVAEHQRQLLLEHERARRIGVMIA